MRSPDTRWAWVEIDQAALRKNTRAFKNLLPRGTKMMCVIKADAYGHGAIPCARIMHAAGADQFAVATVDEGVALREGGITWPVVMLSEPPVESVPLLVEHDIMPTVYTEEFALAYGEAAAAAGKVGYYHLAVDTGMNRIGLRSNEVVDFRRAIDFHRGLVCAGTFTHFATADEPRNWDFELQVKRFKDAIGYLRDAGFDPGLVHCDNTPGTVLHPELHMDMARVGVGLYGMHPCDATRGLIDLEPVMSVRARVTRELYPSVGAGVSYGCTYRVPKQNVQVATIPIGYADGLSRTLSNRMKVLCHGMRCRQAGNICMDQCMFAIDVNTNRSYHPSDEVHYGDLVTIIGRDGDEEITVDEMAELRGTINYEVTCDFGLRLQKVYV